MCQIHILVRFGGGHFGFMQITGVAQGCQAGNQAKFSLEVILSKKQSKKRPRQTIFRLPFWLPDYETYILCRCRWNFPSAIYDVKSFLLNM